MFTVRMQFLIKKTIRYRTNSFLTIISALLFLNFFSVLESKAQRDIIITQADEEIRCRILDETPTRFIYAYIGPKGKVLRNEIFKNLVKNFNYNQYDSDIVTANIKNGRERKSKKSAIEIDKSKKGLNEEIDNLAKNESPKITDSKVNSEVPISKDMESDSPAVLISKSELGVSLEKATKKSEEPKDQVSKGEKTAKTTGNKKKANFKVSNVEDIKEVEKTEISSKANVAAVLPKKDKVLDSNALKSLAEKENKLPLTSLKDKVPVEKDLPIKKDIAVNAPKTNNDSKDGLAKGKLSDENTTKKVFKEVVVDSELKESDIALINKKVSEDKTEPKKEVLANEVESNKTIPISPEIATNEFKNYLKWRIGVKAGIGNILENSLNATNAFGLYQEKLLKGWTFGADIAFFPMEGFGLGVVYSDFQSSNSAQNLNFINQMTDVEVNGDLTNKVSRKFIGPSLFLRKSIDYKTFVVLGVSPGIYYYSDKGNYNGASFDYRGKGFGAAGALGLDFLLGNDIIGRDIILSLEAGYNSGKLNEIDYGDGLGNLLLTNPIIMDRLDFSIGLRFMRFPKYLKK